MTALNSGLDLNDSMLAPSPSLLPWAVSAFAFLMYGAYLAIPNESSLESVYSRYVVLEEQRPRVLENGIQLRFDREAPPIAALEEALREQPWGALEKSPALTIPATELRATAAATERMADRIITDNKREWSAIRTHDPQDIAHRRALSTASSASEATSNGLRLPPPPTQPVVISSARYGLTRDQMLAALFMPLANSGKAVRTGGATKAVRTKPGPSLDPQGEASFVDGRVGNPDVVGRMAPRGRQILLRGPIEFSGGLAVTHSGDRLVVSREADGRLVEAGSVSLREARYEIYVESLDGQLVAELRAPHGEVVGRGELELSHVLVAPDQRRVDGVLLKVTPVTNGLVGHVRSAYATGPSDQGIRGARIAFPQTSIKTQSQGAGYFEERRFAQGSRVLGRITAKDHRPSIATFVAGKETAVPLFPGKMMAAFEGLTAKGGTESRGGLIWGRVVKNGVPAEGAQIDVLTEGAEAPIYFSELMLPDRNRSATSSNGVFAIPVTEGQVQTIQVASRGKRSEPIFITVQENAVSPIELDVAMRATYPAKAYDAFRTEWPVAVDIHPTGHESERVIRLLQEPTEQRPHRVSLRHLGQPIALDVEAGPEYVRTRVIQNPDSRVLLMPMVQKAWLDRIVASVRFNPSLNDGAAMGFIQGSAFKVDLSAESLGPDARVLYFDSRGEVTGQTSGEAGGGFLILGLKLGPQTIIVQADGSDQVYAATVIAEHETMAMLNHWLR